MGLIMKSLLTTLSVLTLATTTGNLINILNTIEEKTNITTNYIQSKTQQDTIYKNKNGEEIKTNIEDLSEIESKEVVQIGFYKNRQGEIQVARMPETIEKVPDKIPSEITSLSYMFTRAKSFNQDLSTWDVSNVTDMSSLFSATSVLMVILLIEMCRRWQLWNKCFIMQSHLIRICQNEMYLM
ncbi:BspA family leucine-rich repeat surface protein [Spiroplasma endosymbiont of Nomada rufipes]|uniref:BspA family leucine-rich repeat surface protein n=1 Tax=Spiroplasma endosymbiont of Nomada rufipes TaxID=3077933 RepID=UPI00376F01B3